MLSLAAAIADGAAIDWAAVESRVHSPERLQIVRHLRTLADVTGVHRTADLPGSDAAEHPIAPSPPRPIDDLLGRLLGGGRFIIKARLGKGAFGTVYEAYDQQRGAHLAIKRVHGLDIGSTYDVKKEFRVLADLCHPNLVTLYDLFADGDDSFIAMELVRGVDFLSYLWGHGKGAAPDRHIVDGKRRHRISDWKRLERAVSQLVRALCYLHEHGKLHRDVKPTNVLVTPDGRLKVLDFGLTTDVVPEVMGETIRIRGTPAYVAPEQAAGQAASEASDWYSVGVMLFEAITGQRPFDGGFLQVLEAKQCEDAAPLSALCSDIPEPLDTLCRDLLDRRPERRPSDAEVVARLEQIWPPSTTRTRTRPMRRARAPFIGRVEQLAVLDQAFEAAMIGRAQMVFVGGSSGLGKTALVRRFLDELHGREPDAVLVTGRCYERESVPYKALDAVVDRLSHYLRTLPSSEVEALLPHDVAALTRLFPVLQRVDAIAGTRFRPVRAANAQELRRRSFAAFRELLARLSDRHPVVLVIDDLQWGDSDSAALIADLMFGTDAPPLLFVACYRFEDLFSSAALRMLLLDDDAPPAACDLHRVEVAELNEQEAYELAAALTKTIGGAATTIESIVRESGGSPFFINELIQYSTATMLPGDISLSESAVNREISSRVVLDGMIRARTGQLGEGAQRLLHALAIFGGPLTLSVAIEAAGLKHGGVQEIMLLRAAHLTRIRVAGSSEEIEFYHDRIREAILADIPKDEVPRLHARLAAVLQRSDDVNPETLLFHFRGAGQLGMASMYALAAADRARNAVAFDRAASYYRLALELGEFDKAKRCEIEIKLGDALATSGRGYEAAQAYIAAAKGAPAAELIELHRRAADQLLRSGHLDEGLDAIRRVLDALGMKLADSPARALISLFLRRAWIRIRGLGFQARDRSQISAEQQVRVDACWTVATAIGVVDTICGADFQARHLILALDTGDSFRVARALALESAYVALDGSRTVPRQRRLIDMARRLADSVGQPEMLALVTLANGTGAFFQGQWRIAHDFLERAESMLRECTTSIAWELDTAYLYDLIALFYLGELNKLSRRLPGFLKEARERDDLTATTNLRTRVAYLIHLAADNPEQARQEVRQGMETWARGAFHAQHSWEMYACGEIELYCGRGSDAWRRVNENWHYLKRSLLLRIQAVRIESQCLRGRSALAAALEPAVSDAARRHLVRSAARSSKQLRREDATWAAALAALIDAGVSTLRGDWAGAARQLEHAEAAFEQADMALHAAVARRRRGELVGGSEGERLVSVADDWMTGQAIAKPVRIVEMLAPGRFGRRDRSTAV